MSLRLRTLLTLIIILGLSLVLMMVVMHRYIFSAFDSLEHLHFDRVGEHIVQTLDGQEDYFSSFVRDWGVWNDSYQFILDQNQQYIDGNLNDETLTGIGTLCILYFDLDFNLVYAFSFAEDRPIALSVADSVKRSQEQIQALNLEEHSSFYLCVEQLNGPLLAAMYPIYPTDRSRPANGYILMGRAINNQYCYDVSSHSGFDFDLVKVCEQSKELNGRDKCIHMSYEFVSEDYAELTLTVRNIDHHQAFKMKTKIFREMNSHLRQVFKVTVTVMIILGVIGVLLVELLLNRLVLAPISAQINHFNRIGESGDLSERFEDHSSRELHLLSQTANRMLDRIESLNKELQRASMTDSLTGVGNRRMFDDQLQHEWLVARRNGTVVSLLMIDIDHFKVYNDTYGHQGGDQCLQTVAEVISAQVKREADLVARYGGEEFAVILPDVPLFGAEKVAESIRQAVNDLGIPNIDAPKTPWITISVGYASMSPQSGQDCEELLRYADQALYQAKKAGRNCIQSPVT
nr:diguanylate cyclase [uncultured Desulfuromonas sp.]